MDFRSKLNVFIIIALTLMEETCDIEKITNAVVGLGQVGCCSAPLRESSGTKIYSKCCRCYCIWMKCNVAMLGQI